MAGMSTIANRRRDPYEKLKLFLFKNHISQAKFGSAIGKKSSAINQKLNGTGGDFSLSEARVLCATFEIPHSFFFDLNVPLKERSEGE